VALGFTQGVLRRGAPDAGHAGDRVNRQVATAVLPALPSDHRQRGDLAHGETGRDLRGQGAR
jgi:hypothetical protein